MTACDTPILGPWAGTTRTDLTVVFFDGFLDHDAQPALDLFLAHDPLGRLPRFGHAGKAPASSAATQPLRSSLSPLTARPAVLPILFLFLRAAIPQQPVAFTGTLWTFHRMIDHVGAILATRVRLAMDFPPLQILRLDMVAKPTILTAGAWDDGQEPALSAGDEAQVVAAAQLAVGDVQEATMADELTQERPGIEVDCVIAGVAVVQFAVQRHRSVVADGNAVQQLFEIGAVV